MYIVGPYCYTQDLLQLQSSCSLFPIAREVLGEPPIVTKSIHNWEKLLSQHHDTQLKDYILLGLIRIGFSWSQPLTSVRRNIPSANTLPGVVDEYIRKEWKFCLPTIITNAVEWADHPHKPYWGGHNSGKWRLITDLPSG